MDQRRSINATKRNEKNNNDNIHIIVRFAFVIHQWIDGPEITYRQFNYCIPIDVVALYLEKKKNRIKQ